MFKLPYFDNAEMDTIEEVTDGRAATVLRSIFK